VLIPIPILDLPWHFFRPAEPRSSFNLHSLLYTYITPVPNACARTRPRAGTSSVRLWPWAGILMRVQDAASTRSDTGRTGGTAAHAGHQALAKGRAACSMLHARGACSPDARECRGICRVACNPCSQSSAPARRRYSHAAAPISPLMSKCSRRPLPRAFEATGFCFSGSVPEGARKRANEIVALGKEEEIQEGRVRDKLPVDQAHLPEAT